MTNEYWIKHVIVMSIGTYTIVYNTQLDNYSNLIR